MIACVLFNYKIHNLSRGSNTYFTRYQNHFLIYGCIYFIKHLSRNRMCKIRFIRLVLYPNRHLYDLENEHCIIKQSKRVNYYRLLLNRPRVFLNYSRSNKKRKLYWIFSIILIKRFNDRKWSINCRIEKKTNVLHIKSLWSASFSVILIWNQRDVNIQLLSSGKSNIVQRVEMRCSK